MLESGGSWLRRPGGFILTAGNDNNPGPAASCGGPENAEHICFLPLDFLWSRCYILGRNNHVQKQNPFMKTAPLPSDLLQSPRWSWHIPSEETATAIRAARLSDDDMVKRTAVRAVYRCGAFFLKFEYAASLMTSFRNRLHPKARIEYEIGRSLAEAGIPAVRCEGWGQMGGMNVLITRALTGFESLDNYFYSRVVYGGENADGLLSEITAFLRKSFDAGFLHGDLHFGNILYNPASHEMAWVDLIAISRPGRVSDAECRAMSRCVVSLREGMSRAQMLRTIRETGAATTDAEAERFYFDTIRQGARHLVETWEKRRTQMLGGYPKFSVALPCPFAPGKTILLRKDWLRRTLVAPESLAAGMPSEFEEYHAKDEAEAETLFLRSLYLQILRVRHRRVAAFLRPNILWFEPLPAGLEPMPPAPGDANTAFDLRSLDEQMIEAPADAVCRLPEGFLYLRDIKGLFTGFEV